MLASFAIGVVVGIVFIVVLSTFIVGGDEDFL